MNKNRLEAFSDGVLAIIYHYGGVIYIFVALMWLVPDKRIERIFNENK